MATLTRRMYMCITSKAYSHSERPECLQSNPLWKIHKTGHQHSSLLRSQEHQKQASITPRVIVLQMQSKMRNKALCSRRRNKFRISEINSEIYRHKINPNILPFFKIHTNGHFKSFETKLKTNDIELHEI